MRRLEGCHLWLGHVGDLRNVTAIHAEGIQAVVDLAGNEPPSLLPRDLTHCRFPLIDGAGNPRWLLRAAVETVVHLLRSQVSTLIVCGTGMSRTPAIAGAALAIVRDLPLPNGLVLVSRNSIADVSPALWAEVQSAMA